MKDSFRRDLCVASLLVCGIGAWADDNDTTRENPQRAVTRLITPEPGSRSEAQPEVKPARGRMTGSIPIADDSARLLNVDFGAWGDVEVGFAAVGHTADDVWNGYAAPWALLGELASTVWSDGTPSPVRVTVQNAPGQWGSDVQDPMYRSYIYPHDGGSILVSISNLPPALYDLYLYGHGGPNAEQQVRRDEDNQQNSVFRVSTPGNAAHYGEAATSTTSAWHDPVWKEGSQYVVFRKIAVADGRIEISVDKGGSSYAIISGLQVVETGKLSGLREDFSSVLSIGKPNSPPAKRFPPAPAMANRPAGDVLSREMGAGLLEEEGNRAFEQAIRSYQIAISHFDRQRPTAASAIFRLGECYRKLGRFEEAKVQYARILREFPDQTELVEHSRRFLAAPRSSAVTPAQAEAY